MLNLLPGILYLRLTAHFSRLTFDERRSSLQGCDATNARLCTAARPHKSIFDCPAAIIQSWQRRCPGSQAALICYI